ncbi:MAG: DUF2232 domain-containing protein [Firmicutes bacterium]|nr:DUF2232 domain-containing protein [Bacillota bacterium]
MKAFIIGKTDLKYMLKILTFYAIALFVGAISGFLPLFSILAGFPVLIAHQQLGIGSARLMTIACLLLTWIMVDPILFIIIGLGIIIGYSLVFWRGAEQKLGTAYQLAIGGGTIWLGISNLVSVLLEKKSLLTIIIEAWQAIFSLVAENMASLDVYSEEQLQLLAQLQEQTPQFLSRSWLFLTFMFVFFATTACIFLLARYQEPVASKLSQWREFRGPAALAGLTLLAYLWRLFLPDSLPWLLTNILLIGNFLFFLSGYALLFFYLRHWRFSWGLGFFLSFYLFMSPWLRQVLILVGIFDALFDYRHFARSKSEGR